MYDHMKLWCTHMIMYDCMILWCTHIVDKQYDMQLYRLFLTLPSLTKIQSVYEDCSLPGSFPSSSVYFYCP